MIPQLSRSPESSEVDAAVLEAERLAALRELHILDTPAEDSFDRITHLAARIFDMPICLVSLIDEHRQWFKSCWGLADHGVFARETPLDISFCVHALSGYEVMVVPDTHLDERFSQYPVVTGSPGIRFYAGAPLRVQVPHEGDRREGSQRRKADSAVCAEQRRTERRGRASRGEKYRLALGTLCLVDTRPRSFGREQRAMLGDLAMVVENEIRLRFTATSLQREIAARNAAEAKLARAVAGRAIAEEADMDPRVEVSLRAVLDSSAKLDSAQLPPQVRENLRQLRVAAERALALREDGLQ